MSESEEPPRTARLDPDQAIAKQKPQRAERPLRSPPPAVNTRRYQWMIGGLGLLLVLIFSVYLYAHNGVTAPGIAGGKRLHYFVAPLATSNLDVAANAAPHCNPARPARRGLNVCGRSPLVLDLFATGAGPCVQSVDALQRISSQFPGVQFGAVAVNASRQSTDALVRTHHWTIPVAYDVDGRLEEIYDVAVCPLIELAYRGGIVAQRLIGKTWEQPDRLASKVRQLLG